MSDRTILHDDKLIAVRRIRAEADRLRITCIAATRTSALLHVAFDRSVANELPAYETALLNQLKNIP